MQCGAGPARYLLTPSPPLNTKQYRTPPPSSRAGALAPRRWLTTHGTTSWSIASRPTAWRRWGARAVGVGRRGPAGRRRAGAGGCLSTPGTGTRLAPSQCREDPPLHPRPARPQVQQYTVCAQLLFNPRKAKLRPEVRLGQALALERAALLAKLIVNLHFYAEGRCAPQLRDAFVRRLLELLAPGGPGRLAAAAHNLRQLFSLMAPFAPPLASDPDRELLKEIDMALYRDLLTKLTVAAGAAGGGDAASAAGATQQAPLILSSVPAAAQQQQTVTAAGSAAVHTAAGAAQGATLQATAGQPPAAT